MVGAVVVLTQQDLEFIVVRLLPAARRPKAGIESPLQEVLKRHGRRDFNPYAQGSYTATVFAVMSRRRQGLFAEILDQFVELPFWASIIGAVVLFTAIRFGAGLIDQGSMLGKLLASTLPGLAPYVAALVLAAGLLGVVKRHRNGLLLSWASRPGTISAFHWRDFERVVGEVYRRQGYKVVERGGPRPDGGIDLELHRGSEKVIVQCKHWVNREVPVQRVRELLGVITAEGADRGIFVATSGFTSDARMFAAGQPIELLDWNDLARLAKEVKQLGHASEQSSASSAGIPACPLCAKPMVKRTARRGRFAGSAFWGCSSYPACRGTLAA
jgi:restriction system protein